MSEKISGRYIGDRIYKLREILKENAAIIREAENELGRLKMLEAENESLRAELAKARDQLTAVVVSEQNARAELAEAKGRVEEAHLKTLQDFDELIAAARAMVLKLDQITKDTKHIWTYMDVHNMPYQGANYADELARLRQLVNEQATYEEI